MRYALNLPAFGAFADVHALASLAREAEDAGWDGFFMKGPPDTPTIHLGVRRPDVVLLENEVKNL